MKLFIIEYIIFTLLFFTLYAVSLKQGRKKSIIPVKNLRHLCRTEVEKRLYDVMHSRGIYVSPHVKLGFCCIPIALEQFKVAILIQPKRSFIRRLGLRHKELYLRSTGWKVFKFSEDVLEEDFDLVVQAVFDHEKIKKI